MSGPTAIQFSALPPSPCTMSSGLPVPPKSRKWTGPSRSAVLWRTASILDRAALPHEGRSHADQDLRHGGGRPPPAFVQAVENRERRKDPDHILGFLDRAARPEPVQGRQPFGKVAGGAGGLVFDAGAGLELAVEPRIRSPRGTCLRYPVLQIVRRIRTLEQGLRGAAGRDAQCLEQPGFRPEVVVEG